jgi:DMSO/TMAO reductase YedYZ molybdopterin-dependent catalytic subunit
MVMRRDQRIAGSVAALTGAGVALLVCGVLTSVWSSFPFPPIVVSEGIAAVIPGRVAAFFIDTLQHTALPLTVVGTGLALALAAWELGRLIPWLHDRLHASTTLAAAVAATPLYVVSILAFRPNTTTVGRVEFAIGVGVAFVLGAVGAGRVFHRLTWATAVPSAGGDADLARRSVLRAFALTGGGMVLGAAHLSRFIHSAPDPGSRALRARDVSPAKAPSAQPGDAAFAHISGLTSRVTPTADHYVVDEELFDPQIDPKTWRLRVFGSVDTELSITYDQLLSMPAVEQYFTLECISNAVGGNLMSTARWTGVPMRSILQKAGVKPGAVEVVSRAVGGYSDSLPMADALRSGTLIAIGMNGTALPRAHGFPARILAPGHYGMKQPKWLESLEVVDRPYQGYWEHRGWSKTAIVKTTSRMDTTGANAAPYTLAGLAFAGDRGISKVEVSLDQGTTWKEADLESELSAFTWRRWRLPYTPSTSGTVTAHIRATDGKGQLQTSTVVDTYPSGASGYQEVRFDV